MTISLALLCLAPLAIPSPQAQAQVAAAVQEVADTLVATQEVYLPDPRIGYPLMDRELVLYQQTERVRLERIRAFYRGSGTEWPYEGVYRLSPSDVIPSGYRMGGTAIACSALLRTPGFHQSPERIAAVERSLEFIIDMLANDPTMSPAPNLLYDVRAWGQCYALTAFLDAIDANAITSPGLLTKAPRTVRHLILCLETNANPPGGWNYSNNSRACTFMTGSILIALYQANARGYPVDSVLVNNALDALEANRTSMGTYTYSNPASAGSVVSIQASSARAPVAELALFLAGRSDAARLQQSVDNFFTSWPDLEVRRGRQGTHADPHDIAPYYFFFGHLYASLAIEHLPQQLVVDYRAQMRRALLFVRDVDGTWNDRIFPRSATFGSAMSSLALQADLAFPLPMWP